MEDEDDFLEVGDFQRSYVVECGLCTQKENCYRDFIGDAFREFKESGWRRRCGKVLCPTCMENCQ